MSTCAPTRLRLLGTALRDPLKGAWICCLLLSATSCGPSGSNDFVERGNAILRSTQDGQFVSAERNARTLVADAVTAHPDSSVAVAEALDVLVECLWYSSASRDSVSIDLAQRTVNLKERLYGLRDERLALSLSNLAVHLEDAGRRSEGRAAHERAIDIARAALPPDDPLLARVLTHYGGYLTTADEYDDAQRALEHALSILDDATGSESMEVAGVLNKTGICSWRQGDYKQARQSWERMLAIREAEKGPNSSSVAAALNNLAAVDVQTGDYETALALYKRTLEIRMSTLEDPNHRFIGRATSNKAEMHFMLGQYEEAESSYARALEIARHNDNPLAVASGLHGLGRVQQELGDHDRAARFLGEAFSIRNATPGQRHRAARSLHYLAQHSYTVGNLDSARARCEQAIDMRAATLGAAHPETAESMGLLAAILLESGETSAAIELARQAETLAASHVRLTSRSLAEHQALLYAGIRTRGLDVMLQAAATHEDLPTSARVAIWSTLAESRALVLDEMATRSRAVAQSADPEVAELRGRFEAASSHLANLTLRGPGGDAEEHEERVRVAKRAQELAARHLAERSEAFRVRLATDAVRFEDLVQKLPPTTALVAYAIYDHHERSGASSNARDQHLLDVTPHLMALILDTEGKTPAAVHLGPVGAIDSLVQRWRREAALGAMSQRTREQNAAAYAAAGSALRKRIWDPVTAALGDAAQIFVVPAGSIHLVNFAALPVSVDRFLIEEGRPIHYLSAERDLVPVHTNATNEGMLALGSPDFDASVLSPRFGCSSGAPQVAQLRGASGPCSGLPDLATFTALPQTGVEARSVAAAWNRSASTNADATVLLDASATEVAFKEHAQGKRNLHLATHGFFLDASCRSATASNEDPRDARRGVGVAYSLQHAGLALSGANNSRQAGLFGEDGVLLAREIAAMNLQGVEWAVLSACDTGVGEVQVGEGVLGLRRAFQVAGVQTLVMSLWPVSDEATRAWMQQLYANRLNLHHGAADAVHHASLEVLKQRRLRAESTHPFYWASFVAAGNWN